MDDKPQLILIAGPNGSGKSTITNQLMSQGLDFGIYINPDEIAARLTGDDINKAKQAQAIAEKQRHSLLQKGVSHSFESVMSHPSKVEYMVTAKAKGFHVTLVFVGIDDPAINVQRVQNRVKKGGHAVPIDKIIQRYKRTMELLFDATQVADDVMIFDNTDMDNSMRLVAKLRNGDLINYEKGVPWLQKHFVKKFEKQKW
ncbi:MAG: zeta toxin family protein [Endozoicomonas sp.]|uniref:zeta toxin family protein n=1 Tax=Endozoicomonas sp. TaxID=1892382 RepID=UPI003D9BC6C6